MRRIRFISIFVIAGLLGCGHFRIHPDPETPVDISRGRGALTIHHGTKSLSVPVTLAVSRPGEMRVELIGPAGLAHAILIHTEHDTVIFRLNGRCRIDIHRPDHWFKEMNGDAMDLRDVSDRLFQPAIKPIYVQRLDRNKLKFACRVMPGHGNLDILTIQFPLNSLTIDFRWTRRVQQTVSAQQWRRILSAPSGVFPECIDWRVNGWN